MNNKTKIIILTYYLKKFFTFSLCILFLCLSYKALISSTAFATIFILIKTLQELSLLKKANFGNAH